MVVETKKTSIDIALGEMDYFCDRNRINHIAMKDLTTALLTGSLLPAALWAQERPNIIYIMTDQQTATAMSCAGNPDVRNGRKPSSALRPSSEAGEPSGVSALMGYAGCHPELVEGSHIELNSFFCT